MKTVIKLVVALLVLLGVLGFFKNWIVRSAVSKAITSVAHVPVRIGATDVRLMATSILLKDIKVENPSGFPERGMLDIGQIYIDFESKDLGKGVAHFEELRLDLRELTVIRNRDGKLNIDSLKPTGGKSGKEGKPAEKGNAPKLLIDRLYLSIGRVVYKDYSAGGAPEVQTFDINIKDRAYANVENPNEIMSLLMVEALTKTTLSRLADLDLDLFKDGASGVLSKGLGLVDDGTGTLQQTANNLLGLFK